MNQNQSLKNIKTLKELIEELLKSLQEIRILRILERLEELKHLTSLGQQKEFLTLEETCILLNVRETTVYNYRKAGLLKAHKINRKLFFRRSEVQTLIEKGKSN